MMSAFTPRMNVAIICALSAVMVCGFFLAAVFSLQNVKGGIIVHFNDIGGINLTGGIGDVAYIFSFGIVAVFLDYFLAAALVKRSLFWGYFAAATGVLAALLISVALGVIISTNA